MAARWLQEHGDMVVVGAANGWRRRGPGPRARPSATVRASPILVRDGVPGILLKIMKNLQIILKQEKKEINDE
jgi:hypothetical protein